MVPKSNGLTYEIFLHKSYLRLVDGPRQNCDTNIQVGKEHGESLPILTYGFLVWRLSLKKKQRLSKLHAL